MRPLPVAEALVVGDRLLGERPRRDLVVATAAARVRRSAARARRASETSRLAHVLAGEPVPTSPGHALGQRREAQSRAGAGGGAVTPPLLEPVAVEMAVGAAERNPHAKARRCR